ncbi:MAG TPA: DEAD/DEAH box helicase, partial [Syntrophorhabdaceae bacterium]|nr:DEAD/DEAH box helicase [Syntrophorhabdaceae bacterium]
PDTTDAYTHRIGRTGRAAKTGDAFTFVCQEDEPQVRAIERVLGARIERRTVKDFDYTTPAPERNVEFARPPRPQRRDRAQVKPERAGTGKEDNKKPGTGSPGSARAGLCASGPKPAGPSTQRHRRKRTGPSSKRRGG